MIPSTCIRHKFFNLALRNSHRLLQRRCARKQVFVFAKHRVGCRRTNADGARTPPINGISRGKLTTFGQGGRSVLLERFSAVQGVLVVEVVVDEYLG
jgi:hypothetical protein